MDPTLAQLLDRETEKTDRAALARREASVDARAWNDAVMHALSAKY